MARRSLAAAELGGVSCPSALRDPSDPAHGSSASTAAGRWVFAYGSLLWRPEPGLGPLVVAHLDGYRREFCIYAVKHRGTTTYPGIVLGLVPSPGHCSLQGAAFFVPDRIWLDVYARLVQREQAAGAYLESWLRVRLESGGMTDALAFVADRSRPTWAGEIDGKTKIDIISNARGISGSNAEYLFNIENMLRRSGIDDSHIFDLAEKVRGNMQRCPSAVRRERTSLLGIR